MDTARMKVIWFVLLPLTMELQVFTLEDLCCSQCSTLGIDPLNLTQRAQIRRDTAFIRSLEENPDLLYYPQNQRPVVTLTVEQENQLLRNFPQMFKSQQEFLVAQEHSGTITVPTVNTTKPQRRRRRATSQRVCEPNPSVEPLVLVLGTDSQLVQIAQTDHFNQWILHETCLAMTDPETNQACGQVERVVPVVFINLLGIGADFDFAYVVVQSCITLR